MQPSLAESNQISRARGHGLFLAARLAAWIAFLIVCALCQASQTNAASDHEMPGPGFAGELPASLDDVLQVVQDVARDQIIHGTYMYDKLKTLTGAVEADSTPLFEPWRGDGKVFYKVRTAAIAPRHFRDSADQGTIVVRYVVTAVSAERTRVRIDAIFVENAHHGDHASDGTVETSEYKEIQQRVQSVLDTRAEAVEKQRRVESIELANQTLVRQREDEFARLATAESSARDLQQQVDALRHQVEMRVKAPGASLKTAPFRSAAEVAPLSAYTAVVIVIVTPRWLGVETPTGQRGWLPQDQLEPLP